MKWNKKKHTQNTMIMKPKAIRFFCIYWSKSKIDPNLDRHFKKKRAIFFSISQTRSNCASILTNLLHWMCFILDKHDVNYPLRRSIVTEKECKIDKHTKNDPIFFANFIHWYIHKFLFVNFDLVLFNCKEKKRTLKF